MAILTAYTNIDSLFDFRLAVIAKHSGIGYNDVFVKDVTRYLTRNHNRFWEWTDAFTKEQYESWYQQRSIDDWKLAGITEILDTIVNDYDELCRKEGKIQYELLVDLQHYELTKEERNTLKTHLLLKVNRDIIVTLVRVEKDELTPKFIEKHFNFLYAWDFDSWFKVYRDDLLENPVGDVMWFTTINTLYTNEEQEKFLSEVDHTPSLTAQQREIINNPAFMIHALLLGYIDLTFLTLRSYSLANTFIGVSKGNKKEEH